MLDANSIYSHEIEVDKKTKMPTKEFRTLKEKLLRATTCIKQRPDPQLEQVDYAFQTIFIDPEDDSEGVNDIEIRDAFLEFMSKTMGDYKKFLRYLSAAQGGGVDTVPEHANSRDFFDREKFLQSKDSMKQNSFLFKLTNTTIFGCFIEARSLGANEHDE